jgi:hypothetical protein
MNGIMGSKESKLLGITRSLFALQFSNIPSFQHSKPMLGSGNFGTQIRVLNLKGRA